MLQMLQFALPEYIVGLHTRCHLIFGLVLAAGLSADDVELSVQHFLQLPDFQITSIKQLGYANTLVQLCCCCCSLTMVCSSLRWVSNSWSRIRSIDARVVITIFMM